LRDERITELHNRSSDIRANAPLQVNPIFISYSHADAAFVQRLCDVLDAKGIRYWRDLKNATAGPIDRVIEHGLSSHRTMLLVLSAASISSGWVKYEIESAIEKGRTWGKHVLCPIALDECWRSDQLPGNIRTLLKEYLVLDFSSWQNKPEFQ